MKIIISILLLMVTPLIFSEELSSISEEEISKTVYKDALTIPDCVRIATVAGVGLFLNEPSPADPFVDIQVQQWMTPALNTNTVRIHELDPYSTNWEFPTNVPVAFFAVTKRQVYSNHSAIVNPDAYPPEWVYSITNAAEMSKLMFLDVDRSWFRTTRDNGLVYTFATNLWECMRTNPNPTNYYTVLRDTERTVPKQDSWRTHLDTRQGLWWLFSDASESSLAEKLSDPFLSSTMKGNVRATLYDKFGWRYVNGIITPLQ